MGAMRTTIGAGCGCLTEDGDQSGSVDDLGGRSLQAGILRSWYVQEIGCRRRRKDLVKRVLAGGRKMARRLPFLV